MTDQGMGYLQQCVVRLERQWDALENRLAEMTSEREALRDRVQRLEAAIAEIEDLAVEHDYDLVCGAILNLRGAEALAEHEVGR